MNNPNAHYAGTATKAEAMQDIRLNHMRHVAANFLNETKALNLERDLTDFLVKIDEQHQEQMRALNLRMTEILSGRQFLLTQPSRAKCLISAFATN